MLAAYSLDRNLDAFMRTNNDVLNGEYGANDDLYKQCALLTRIAFDTAIRPDANDVGIYFQIHFYCQCLILRASAPRAF